MSEADGISCLKSNQQISCSDTLTKDNVHLSTNENLDKGVEESQYSDIQIDETHVDSETLDSDGSSYSLGIKVRNNFLEITLDINEFRDLLLLRHQLTYQLPRDLL